MTSFTVGTWFTGYVYVQFAIFINGLPFDLTPSINPGCGNCIFHPVAGFQLKKLFRFRVLGDVFRQVTPELFQFQVVDGDDIVTHAVEQTGIVRHDDARDVLQRQEVSFDPLDVHDVQVVRRFVHQQDVCVQTHRSRQRQLHSPTTG